METENSYRGGVFIKLWSDSYKIVKTNLTGMWMRLKKVEEVPGRLSLYSLREAINVEKKKMNGNIHFSEGESSLVSFSIYHKNDKK